MLAIIDELRRGGEPDARWLDRAVRAANAKTHDAKRRVAKKRLLPFYLRERAADTPRWRTWGVDDELDGRIVELLRAKPRRTASGVATVTVLTKPWPCTADCIYCPNDPAMPKSYLSDEPACQRAARCGFDPYLQVASRLGVLADMGHNTDKVELIVLGGTFSEYPESYQLWFVTELFRALNDLGSDGFAEQAAQRWEAVESGRSLDHPGTFDELERQHRRNEDAAHRNVGLVVETRPDCIDREHLAYLRRLGCTKIQLGVQSLNPAILRANCRKTTLDDVVRAFELLREAGFKSHVHIMANLLGATPATDKADYRTLVTDPRFMPDEVKLYPCALVESARLMGEWEAGRWRPYSEEELIDVLAADVLATPSWTRISRMIRDISSTDIVAGNKKTNLRQLVEADLKRRCEEEGATVREMRLREIATDDADEEPRLEVVPYATTNTDERFLQYVTNSGRLVAFLRLSLPRAPKESRDAAMIREVHVYGKVSRLHEAKEGSQHLGLGRALVEAACAIAADRGFGAVDVISAVGTRNYYRGLDFADNGLYQRRELRP